MKTTVLINATIYTGKEEIKSGFIRYGKTILAVGEMKDFEEKEEDTISDVSGKIIVPGFIDVHSHGGYSWDSMDGNSEEINQMVHKMQKEGITSYFATTMTQSYENIDKAMVAIKKAAETNPIIQGIHLEGPFVYVVFKGAQPEEYIKTPDAE
ncbi:MAG: amidohydrolase family protein, partial [Carnobacterium sp.]